MTSQANLSPTRVVVKNTFFDVADGETVTLTRQLSAPVLPVYGRQPDRVASDQAVVLTSLLCTSSRPQPLSSACAVLSGSVAKEVGVPSGQLAAKGAGTQSTLTDTVIAATGTSASSGASDTAAGPRRRIRPCKAKREKWREAIARLEEEAAENPSTFDPRNILLPTDLMHNSEIVERVRERLGEVTAFAREQRGEV